MDHLRRAGTWVVVVALLLCFHSRESRAQTSVNPAPTEAQKISEPQDHQHDFDFEFGSWKTHIRRLLHPLTGSDEWIDLDGRSVVHKVWDGRANLGELEVSNPATHLEGLSMRLYSPEARLWSIYWSNSKDGSLGTPMIGRFSNGRGEFYNQETLAGKAIFVRFIFSDVSASSFRLEQAFSPDGGKTWEPNWIATFSKEKE